MQELIVFNNEQFGEIRTIENESGVWFVAADVCKALEIADTGRAIERLDSDESTRIEIDHPQSIGKKLTVWAVNEYGLYGLVLGSRKKEAKEFKRWIKHDVLPSIRKTGSYVDPKASVPTVRMSDALAAMANVARLAEDNQRRLDAIETSAKELDSKLTGVVDTLTAPTADSDVWQTETRKTVTKLIQDNKLSYQAYWADLYERLELRAGVNLETRKKRLRERLAKQGAAKHVINNVSKLLVISQDKKLVDIFNSIVREEKTKYVLMKGGIAHA